MLFMYVYVCVCVCMCVCVYEQHWRHKTPTLWRRSSRRSAAGARSTRKPRQFQAPPRLSCPDEEQLRVQ